MSVFSTRSRRRRAGRLAVVASALLASGAAACGPTVVQSAVAAPAPAAAGEQTGATSQPFVRATPPTDSVIRAMWTEGMQYSETERYAHALLDSVGARLTGSPGAASAREWIRGVYAQLGIPAREERYGTWNSWRRGLSRVELVQPRARSLEGQMLAWSPATPNGQPVQGEVIVLPDVRTPEQFQAWLPQARGKFVLIDAPRLSCRSVAQWREFATPESFQRMQQTQDTLRQGWSTRLVAAGGRGMQQSLKSAGALGVIGSYWSGYPGVNKIFGSWRNEVPTFDVGCEDYGMLFRLAQAGSKPVVRAQAESEFLGEQPTSNVIAEIRGTEKPDEVVMLSAHFDSWDGASGATDNGTGTLVMLEAMRILKEHYPNPKRTIMVGHWGGEEQGLNGSRAFTEDHPEVVRGLHALFNQDNGTGRIVSMNPGPFAKAGPVLQGYLAQIPAEITRHIEFGDPTPQQTGGTDHAAFQCHKAPGFNLGALSWDYGNTTWHTNRDTYDKVVFDDLKSNATLVAMLAYLAAEDPTFMPRDLVSPLPAGRSGESAEWQACQPAVRKTSDSRR